MQLYLSSSSPWNATYSNEAGQVIYSAEHSRKPYILDSPPITIKRVLPSNANAAALPDQLSFLAEIKFRSTTLLSAHIRYNGVDISTTEFFRKTGHFWSNRTFEGPDGKEYEWQLGSECKLYLKDPSDTLVAQYHPRKLGFIGAPRPASLEIFPEGQHMADLINLPLRTWSSKNFHRAKLENSLCEIRGGISLLDIKCLSESDFFSPFKLARAALRRLIPSLSTLPTLLCNVSNTPVLSTTFSAHILKTAGVWPG